MHTHMHTHTHMHMHTHMHTSPLPPPCTARCMQCDRPCRVRWGILLGMLNTLQPQVATARATCAACALGHPVPTRRRLAAKAAPRPRRYATGERTRGLQRVPPITVVCLLFCVASNLASPVLSGSLFEILVKQQPLAQYGRLLAVLAAMYILEPLISGVYVDCMCRAADEIVLYLRCEVFRILLLQRIAFFDKHDSTDLVQLVGVHMEEIRSFVYSNVTRDRGLRALLEAVGASVVLFYISWRLGPLMAGVIVATGFTVAQYRLHTKAADAARADALRRVTRVAHQAFKNARTVRSYNGEAFERERFVGYVHEGFREDQRLGRAKALMEMLNRGCIHVSLLALYGLGGYLVHQQLLPISALLTGIGFTYSLVYATQGIVQTSADLRRLMLTINRCVLSVCVLVEVGAYSPSTLCAPLCCSCSVLFTRCATQGAGFAQTLHARSCHGRRAPPWGLVGRGQRGQTRPRPRPGRQWRRGTGHHGGGGCCQGAAGDPGHQLCLPHAAQRQRCVLFARRAGDAPVCS